MSTAARRDYVWQVFERQCEIGLANWEKILARLRRAGAIERIAQRSGVGEIGLCAPQRQVLTERMPGGV